MADIDHFKEINDAFSHLAGDRVIKAVAGSLQQEIRESDHVARYGGEEFIILTPSTDMAGAIVHAERLRNDIENHRFSDIGHLTCSFGVAEFIPETDDMPSIFKRADTALYNAKNLGRNRVESN